MHLPSRTLAKSSLRGKKTEPSANQKLPSTYIALGSFRSDINMAEGEGFEPPEDVNPQRFSRPPRSTALPSFRNTMKYSVCRIHTACEVPCGCSHAALCSRTSVFRSRSFRAKSRRSAGLWQDYWMINPFTTKIFISGFA